LIHWAAIASSRWAVELINRSLTGQTFHRYLCPQRDMPADALVVLSAGMTATVDIDDRARALTK
jgi:hypothetical protein